MMGGLTSDLFIQLTTTLAHLSNMTLNTENFGGTVSNETLEREYSNMFTLKARALCKAT